MELGGSSLPLSTGPGESGPGRQVASQPLLGAPQGCAPLQGSSSPHWPGREASEALHPWRKLPPPGPPLPVSCAWLPASCHPTPTPCPALPRRALRCGLGLLPVLPVRVSGADLMLPGPRVPPAQLCHSCSSLVGQRFRGLSSLFPLQRLLQEGGFLRIPRGSGFSWEGSFAQTPPPPGLD